MKVLWFSITPVFFNDQDAGKGGAGWISALERVVARDNDIQLYVAYLTTDINKGKETKGNITHIPMVRQSRKIDRLRCLFTDRYSNEETVKKSLEIIDAVSPDLIQVFGSEWCFGLVAQYQNIPVVVHMQGFWNEYLNSSFLPGQSRLSEFVRQFPRNLRFQFLEYRKRIQRAEMEKTIMQKNRYFMGRTRWDQAIVRLYNPFAKYYLVNEALRDDIVNSQCIWGCESRKLYTFATLGTCQTLKGHDVILKTAYLLKKHSNISFRWLLIGASSKELKAFEQFTKIRAKDVNVKPCGRMNAKQVTGILGNTDIYIHPSYADNSPNAVCEAQFLGVPIIATNVGGIPSLFSDTYDKDLLVPTNDPYYLASKIIELAPDLERKRKLSALNIELSHSRHDDVHILSALKKAYVDIIRDANHSSQH